MSTKARLVKPENTLKKKVGHGGFNEVDLVKAQKGIDSNDIDFRPMGADLLGELDVALERIDSGATADADKMGEIMYPLMQLKSQGALFKYPLISRISHATLDFLEAIDGVDNDVLVIVGAYKKTIKAILALQLTGEGTEVGTQLLNELQGAFSRYQKSKQSKV